MLFAYIRLANTIRPDVCKVLANIANHLVRIPVFHCIQFDHQETNDCPD